MHKMLTGRCACMHSLGRSGCQYHIQRPHSCCAPSACPSALKWPCSSESLPSVRTSSQVSWCTLSLSATARPCAARLVFNLFYFLHGRHGCGVLGAAADVKVSAEQEAKEPGARRRSTILSCLHARGGRFDRNRVRQSLCKIW